MNIIKKPSIFQSINNDLRRAYFNFTHQFSLKQILPYDKIFPQKFKVRFKPILSLQKFILEKKLHISNVRFKQISSQGKKSISEGYYSHFLESQSKRRQKLVYKQTKPRLNNINILKFNQKMSEQIEIDIDSIINRLLQVRNHKPGKVVKLNENQIYGLIRLVKNVFMDQNMLVDVQAPVKVCGDIHGQYTDMLRMFQYGGFPPDGSYLFLGDYVDRGRQGVQTICLLFAYKIKYPNKVYLLRGNHESASITRIYGFFEECKSRYSTKLWKSFIDCFNCMPVAALIEQRILCMHGGLSPDLVSTQQINGIIRPTDVPDTGLLCDLLWADPDTNVKGWGQSERGVSYVFGGDVVSSFLKKNDLDLVCRAHQVVEDGYEFFHKRQLVTIFSAPNYCGQFNNSGSMMNIDDNLACSFQVLRPQQKVGAFKNGRPKTPIKRGG